MANLLDGMRKWDAMRLIQEISDDVVKGTDTDKLKGAKDFIERLLKYRKVSKLSETFILGPIEAAEFNEEPLIYTEYKLEGTKTGRSSCSGYTVRHPVTGKSQKKGVSFHVLPSDSGDINIRAAYTAPRLHTFITGDYSTMELRVLAYLADIKEMKIAFNEERDLHTYTAALIYGIPPEDVSPEQRQRAKTTNFLIVYGGGATTLASSVGIPLKTAQWIINRHSEVFFELEDYGEKCKAFMRRNGYIESLYGRRRHLPNAKSNVKGLANQAFRQGINFTVQSPANDMCECAVTGMVIDMKEAGIVSKPPFMRVHDSIEQTPLDEETQQVLQIMYDNMYHNPISRSLIGDIGIKMAVDLEAGQSFGVLEEVPVVDGVVQWS